ncbi:MAG TPA: glycosyltransferase family 39 protein [Longimicrobiales bacterium]|nr:glycosyltransferase family 39 protein [Longimicrobiales bacterium]
MRLDAIRRAIRKHPLWFLAAGAIALRLLLFLGRDSYVAFDEGWYLLLGRNLFHGRGYTLSGLQHVALSPLFPILAGALDRVIDHPVWAGRIVAAITAGLLVVPCWYLFRRLAGRRTAFIGAGVVAVMPSLAPFVTAFWIGWDLWVGSEPLLHLAAYAGLALAVAGRMRRSTWLFILAGLVFGLAYLARGEGILVFGIAALALALHALWRRDAPQLGRTALLAAAFALAALPYWVYLHDVTGQWTITGRATTPTSAVAAAGRERRPAASRVIERMLWRDQEAPYVRTLFALDSSGTHLANGYWGVPRPGADAAGQGPSAAAGSDTVRSEIRPPVAQATDSGLLAPTHVQEQPAAQESAATAPAMPPAAQDRGAQPAVVLYVRAINRVVPWLLWPLVLLGAFLPRRRRSFDELLVAAAVLGASAIIAITVAVDPRTQLIVVPLAAFYIARGLHALGLGIDRLLDRDQSMAGVGPRPGFGRRLLVAVALLVLFAVSARRLYFSLSLGSPHNVVGEANQRVGRMLDRRLPPGAAVMSWHPAIALWAHRDWRVLPLASLPRILTYANANDTHYIVLSDYYPAPPIVKQVEQRYLVLHVPPFQGPPDRFQLDVLDSDSDYVFARLSAR